MSDIRKLNRKIYTVPDVLLKGTTSGISLRSSANEQGICENSGVFYFLKSEFVGGREGRERTDSLEIYYK